MVLTQETEKLERAMDNLVSLYREIERRGFLLPSVSIYPISIFIWNMIKFEIGVMLDIILLVPMNIIIFLRNLFPGKWLYRSFSWRYIRYAVLWIWRGEIPLTAVVMIRWFIISLLRSHFIKSFGIIRRQIILVEGPSQEERTLLLSRVDQLLDAWRGPRIFSSLFTHWLPSISILLGLYKHFQPSGLPNWAITASFILFAYVVGIIATAFIIKRGVMLGGEDRSAYFPGFIEGLGSYEEEARIFDSINVIRHEFPLDMLLGVFSLLIGFLLIPILVDLYEYLDIPVLQDAMLIQYLFTTGFVVLLYTLAIYRRKKLRRV